MMRIYQGTLLGLMLVLLSACAGVTYHAKPLNVSLANVQLLKAEVLEQQYLLTLRVQNTNDSTLLINGLTYSLEINDTQLAYGVSSQQNYILPFSEKLIKVHLISNSLSQLKQLEGNANSASRSFNYQLKGKLSLGARFVPTPIVPLIFETSGSMALGKSLKAAELSVKKKL